MEESPGLQDYANTIESELCAFDAFQENKLKDESTLRILGLLQNKYYFIDSSIAPEDNNLIVKGFKRVNCAIGEDFINIPVV